jgi:hypothetical protein
MHPWQVSPTAPPSWSSSPVVNRRAGGSPRPPTSRSRHRRQDDGAGGPKTGRARLDRLPGRRSTPGWSSRSGVARILDGLEITVASAVADTLTQPGTLGLSSARSAWSPACTWQARSSERCSSGGSRTSSVGAENSVTGFDQRLRQRRGAHTTPPSGHAMPDTGPVRSSRCA